MNAYFGIDVKYEYAQYQNGLDVKGESASPIWQHIEPSLKVLELTYEPRVKEVVGLCGDLKSKYHLISPMWNLLIGRQLYHLCDGISWESSQRIVTGKLCRLYTSQ